MDRSAARRTAPGLIEHHLFVSSADGKKNRRLMIDILKFVAMNVKQFKAMGIVVTAHDITKTKRADPNYIQWLKTRGVNSLPALVTPSRVYTGCQAIKNIYIENNQKFKNWQATPARPDADEDLLSTFYQNELAQARIAKNDGNESDDDKSESKNLLDAHRQMMERRSGGKDKKPASDRPQTTQSSAQSTAQLTTSVPPSLRNDNLSTDDFDDGDQDNQDDELMRKYYWGNREESI